MCSASGEFSALVRSSVHWRDFSVVVEHADVLMIFLTQIMISSNALMISSNVPEQPLDIPQCTEHPLMHCKIPYRCTHMRQGVYVAAALFDDFKARSHDPILTLFDMGFF